jgi:predicted O-methyltransferase YrrM
MLQTPVGIYQNEGEFAALLDLYRERKPRRVLELGSYEGGTLYHWLQNARPGAVIVSIDRCDQIDNRHLYPDWIPREITLVSHRGDSADPFTVALAEGYGPYDWIFIDADHHDQAVRADWANYRPLAAPGAAVAFHDITPTADPTVEVDRLWAEIKAGHDTVEYTIEPGRYGIGVVLLP